MAATEQQDVGIHREQTLVSTLTPSGAALRPSHVCAKLTIHTCSVRLCPKAK